MQAEAAQLLCRVHPPNFSTPVTQNTHSLLAKMYSYEINSLNYCLKTMDASSPGNRIVLYNKRFLFDQHQHPT